MRLRDDARRFLEAVYPPGEFAEHWEADTGGGCHAVGVSISGDGKNWQTLVITDECFCAYANTRGPEQWGDEADETVYLERGTPMHDDNRVTPAQYEMRRPGETATD